MEVSWKQFRRLLGLVLVPAGGRFEGSWRPLGGLLGASWGPLGASWGPLGASWGPLGAEGSKCPFWSPVRAPSWSRLGGFLGRLGGLLGRLGALLGRFGGILGPLGPLGAILGRLGAVLSRLDTILNRLHALLDPQKAQGAQIIDFPQVFLGFETQKGHSS